MREYGQIFVRFLPNLAWLFLANVVSHMGRKPHEKVMKMDIRAAHSETLVRPSEIFVWEGVQLGKKYSLIC